MRVLADLVDQIQAAGKTRDKKAIITLNWPQAVLRFHFVEQQAEGKVFIEEVNEGRETVTSFKKFDRAKMPHIITDAYVAFFCEYNSKN